jgi:hypothetical protein
MSEKLQCPNCGAYTFKQKNNGYYSIGVFLTYITGWSTAVLIGLVLTILICVKASKEESKEYKSGRFAAECSSCKYEDIVELRD